MGITKNYRSKVGLDVDDVLLPCTILAVELANKDYHFDPPLTVDEIKSWSPTDERGKVILQYFHKKEFFEAQTPLEGAREFVKKLSKKAEVFAVTAIDSIFMGLRAEQIRKFFPEIPEENYIPTFRKDMVMLDFLLDDGAHNCLSTDAKYPVVMRRPWNENITGILSVNTYDEFLNLFDCVTESYTDSSFNFKKPTVLALVGPSGSGKTIIMNELLKHEKFRKPIAATTRQRRPGEPEDAYHFVTEEKFKEMINEQLLTEHTIYSGQYYGTEMASINNVLRDGKHCVIPIDISGAMSLKMQYRTCIIYIKRDTPDLINALAQRMIDGQMSKEALVSRIVSIEDEKKNVELCDYTLYNNGSVEDAANDILTLMKIKK